MLGTRGFDHLHIGSLLRRGILAHVDGEVVARSQRARRDERGHGDEALDEHGAIADGENVALPVDHLWRGA